MHFFGAETFLKSNSFHTDVLRDVAAELVVYLKERYWFCQACWVVGDPPQSDVSKTCLYFGDKERQISPDFAKVGD